MTFGRLVETHERMSTVSSVIYKHDSNTGTMSAPSLCDGHRLGPYWFCRS